MLREFFDQVFKAGADSATKRVIKLEQEPAHVYGVWNPESGVLETRAATPNPRAHEALDLSAVVEFAKRSATKGEEADEPTETAVWYCRNAVVCLLDDATRRDRVTLPLSPSRQMQQLALWDKARVSVSQRDLIFIIRTTFDGCLGQAGNLLENLRRIKFDRSESGESSVRQGAVSLGKRVVAEVTGIDAIPDYVTLTVPVFAGPVNPGFFDVRCALEADPATASFQVIPLPNAVEQATAEAERAIGEQLRSQLEGCAAEVYYGAP